jgi:hypothetical protein
MGGAKDDRDYLIDQISREESRLGWIDAARSQSAKRLATLRRRLSSLDSDGHPPEPERTRRAPSSNAEKVELFRSLFRGRTDVFPTHWRNERKQTGGYSPACSNEWVPGLCEKPRVKCGDCPHQAFMPVSHEVILDHLQGRHVVGVYPLLPDETTPRAPCVLGEMLEQQVGHPLWSCPLDRLVNVLFP